MKFLKPKLFFILFLVPVAIFGFSSIWTDAIQNGADRLVSLQNNDGGWDWPLDDGNPNNASPTNTIGPIGMGLAQVYRYVKMDVYFAALYKAGEFLLAKRTNFSPSDGYLAVALDKALKTKKYTEHVRKYFYNELLLGRYDKNDAGTLYDTAGYVESIRTSRANQGFPNLAAWDIGMGLVGAASANAPKKEWIKGVKAEIDELDGSVDYDVIGLAGALYGLAFVQAKHDPQAGEHESASSLKDLAKILISYQLDSGGFTWNSAYMNPGEDNETIQETAYAILALNELARGKYKINTICAVNYLLSVQLPTGGWKNWAGGEENNEVTAEALWGICTFPPSIHHQ